MARDEKDKAGTPAEYDLRDDDRPSPEGYGKPRRRHPLLRFVVLAIVLCGMLGLFLLSRSGDLADIPREPQPGIPREPQPGEAVAPVR